MGLSPPVDRRVASAWALSVLGHAAAFGVAGLLVARSFGGESSDGSHDPRRPGPHEELVDLDLQHGGVGGGLVEAPADRPLVEVPRRGGAGTPRLDSGHRGRGGTDEARVRALNLADRDDGLLLSREAMSKLDRDQIQRIRSSSHRASREDWRASRDPMELTLLASGTDGARLERRRPSRYDPSRGVDQGGSPARIGTARGGVPVEGDGVAGPLDPGGPEEGTDHISLGVGVRDGAPGFDARDSARVALARPRVPEGVPSVPAALRGRPSDTLDSEQEVSLRIQSIVHASTPGGLRGAGLGGQEGLGPAGAGGRSGPGSVSHALGDGEGPGLDSDGRRSLYMRGALAKVQPLWYFPKEAALEGKQGTVIVSFTILADGSITPPRIARSSNIPEFDEICRRAVLRAAPFEPLPPELGSSFPWSMPFDGVNPAVRPKAVRPAP